MFQRRGDETFNRQHIRWTDTIETGGPARMTTVPGRAAMNFVDRFARWEGIVFGFILGVAASVVASMAYNQIYGMLRVSQFKRSLHNGQLDEVAAIMEEELAAATTAMKDGVPLEISNYLAFHYMPKLYAHHMDFAMTLLKNEDISKFNSLRDTTHFLTFNLSRRDLGGLNLRSANFTGAELTGADFSNSELAGADFQLAEMPRVNLTNAEVSRTSFFQAVLSSAILTGIHGEETNFQEAVLVDASLTRLDNLQFANFAAAELTQANLFDSKFPEASFDGADFTLASAVGSDFAVVKSMNDVNLTGANLTGARIEPGRLARAWFVNADGLSSRTAQGLRRYGGIARPEEVLDKVDQRIVAGFRAQIEEDNSVRPEDRETVLLKMLQEYYLN
jgi:uncharacterized protein YjbI with pentapeptide repeats